MNYLNASRARLSATCGLPAICRIVICGIIALVAVSPSSAEQKSPFLGDDFLTLIVDFDPATAHIAMTNIEENWSRSALPMAIEAYQYTRSGLARAFLEEMIATETDVLREGDSSDFYYWLWNEDISPSPDYADFKAHFYRNIDPAFATYFLGRQQSARIRLDEIRWGGVQQDGIPPLRNPEMINAADAQYLDDADVVFGIVINGDARAYPKRILAWHEMFTDTIGGVDIAGVYCTLCGTVIPYRTEVNGVKHALGTSGFLYRSNKLMYDAATQSLWSTEKGEPVVGPLVDRGISLEFESVVTTNWGEWQRRHPNTTVLSLNTGFKRDYGEGVAYAEYFATDQLMFNTPFKDARLANKQEVLALRFPGAPNSQLAIDTEFLAKHALYENRIGSQRFIVVTDSSGANRVYDPQDITFVSYDGDSTLKDVGGGIWKLNEESLISEVGRSLNRLPYHRAFWFGWQAAFPETKLIK